MIKQIENNTIRFISRYNVKCPECGETGFMPDNLLLSVRPGKDGIRCYQCFSTKNIDINLVRID